MIVVNDKIVLAVPPKTGSRRMLATFQRHAVYFMHSGFAEHHGAFVANYEHRILISREPLERFVSLYWFLRTLKKTRLDVSSFESFQQSVVDGYCPNKQDPLCKFLHQYKNGFNPTQIVPLENIDALWPIVGEQFRSIYHAADPQSTKNRPSVEETVREGLLSDFEDLLAKDYCELG